jgi:hypothetical protein
VVALCRRHSRDAAPEAAQALWFGALQVYVGALRTLRQAQRAEQARGCLFWQPPEELPCVHPLSGHHFLVL